MFLLIQHFFPGFFLNQSKMELKRCDNFNLDFQALVLLLDPKLAIRDGKDHALLALMESFSIPFKKEQAL